MTKQEKLVYWSLFFAGSSSICFGLATNNGFVSMGIATAFTALFNFLAALKEDE